MAEGNWPVEPQGIPVTIIFDSISMPLFTHFPDHTTDLSSRRPLAFQSAILLGLQTLIVLSHRSQIPSQYGFNLLVCFFLAFLLVSLVGRSGADSLLASSCLIALLGGLGMAGGAMFDPRSCCSSAPHALVSWSFLAMTILCTIGCGLCSETPRESWSRFFLRVGSCIFLMTIGMWGAFWLVGVALSDYFGQAGAAHWSMLAGMFLGTFAGEALFRLRSL